MSLVGRSHYVSILSERLIRSLIYKSAPWALDTSEIHRRDVAKLSTWSPDADEFQEIRNRLSPQRFKGLDPNRWAEGRQKMRSSLSANESLLEHSLFAFPKFHLLNPSSCSPFE